ncbi:MAG: hypothetical protein K8S56_01365, partial [Candidatus Cloacimonetes bacterium]|nr:hypothetical protein [Candidatus Cloacimonadota bacterium]
MEETSKSKSVLSQIFEWSQNQPVWIQDALRRIIVKDQILKSDITELVTLCKKDITGAKPLSKTDLPHDGDKSYSINLHSLGSLEGVNRLPSDQTIEFSKSPGLTVVYGENATGKSGYARVLKKACRSRGSDPEILGNIFMQSNLPESTAKFKYSIGDGEVKEFNWKNNVESDPYLSNVFVFDNHTADHYLSKEDKAVFTPFGLDILPLLVRIYDTVKKTIDGEIAEIKSQTLIFKKGWEKNPETKVSKLMISLNANSDLKEIEAFAIVSDIDQGRFRTITESLKSNPVKKSNETKASVERLKKFVEM